MLVGILLYKGRIRAGSLESVALDILGVEIR